MSPIEPDGIQNRNTWFGVNLDPEGRISLIHKRVYNDIELSHQYEYFPNGALSSALIHTIDDEVIRIRFNIDGSIDSREELSG